ncbi:Fic family protein [Streptomyces sp. NPDC001514]
MEERQARTIPSYKPGPLRGRRIRLSAELAAEVADVDRLVRSFNDSQPNGPRLAALARFLLRSEAVASSRIEGVVASARSIAHLELNLATNADGASRAHHYIGDGTREVVNNALALRTAVSTLAEAPTVTVDDISGLQAVLMAETERHETSGLLRTGQSWAGGACHDPQGATYGPPAPEAVAPLMHDLAAFISEAHPLPLVQAALAHAQFATIHPYENGNGRTGRALIHTALARHGLTAGRVLPISMALLAHAREYAAGLSAYRCVGDPESPAAAAGVDAWIRVFLAGTRDAVAEARRFTDELALMRRTWHAKLAHHRESQGRRGHPRRGAAVAALMEQLPGAPIITARAAQALLGISFVSASNALEELAGAGVVQVKEVERGARAFLATDVLDLTGRSERHLNTKWDLPELDAWA